MTENLPDTNVGNIEYISKQDAIDAAREGGKKIPTLAIRIMHDIKAIPAADVAPVVHAHWIRHDDADIVEGHYVPSFECSQSQLRTEDNILGGLTHEQNRH